MTLKEFLDNPIGKGDTSLNVSLITEALATKYNASYTDSAKEKKKIEAKIYHQPVKDVYWVWLTIPSETGRGNSYDVVYKFTNPKPTNRMGLSIGSFDIQIFANSPSFAYTYAYVYLQNGLLIPELSGKLGKPFTDTPPDTRNRKQLVLFDKYVYFGAKYILDAKILNRAVADAKASKYDAKYISSHIRSLDTIMDEYRKADLKEKKKKRDAKEAERKKINQIKSGSSGVTTIGKNEKIVKNASRKVTVAKKKGTIKKK